MSCDLDLLICHTLLTLCSEGTPSIIDIWGTSHKLAHLASGGGGEGQALAFRASTKHSERLLFTLTVSFPKRGSECKIFTCSLILQSNFSYTMNNMSCQTQHSRVGNSQAMSGKLMTPWGCGLQWIPICDHDLTVVVHKTCSVSKCPDNYSWKTCCVVCEIATMLPWCCHDVPWRCLHQLLRGCGMM